MPALAQSEICRWDLSSPSSGKYPQMEFGAAEAEQRLEVEEGALIWVEEAGWS